MQNWCFTKFIIGELTPFVYWECNKIFTPWLVGTNTNTSFMYMFIWSNMFVWKSHSGPVVLSWVLFQDCTLVLHCTYILHWQGCIICRLDYIWKKAAFFRLVLFHYLWYWNFWINYLTSKILSLMFLLVIIFV